jgi:hypothetical protein
LTGWRNKEFRGQLSVVSCFSRVQGGHCLRRTYQRRRLLDDKEVRGLKATVDELSADIKRIPMFNW